MTAVLTSASAFAEERTKQGIRMQATDPFIAQQVVTRNLATLPDGSFIKTVNGRQSNIVVKPGDTVRISGKGFDQRRDKSVVGLFLPSTTTGALLDIVSWSDGEIVARVPVGNANIATASDRARLKVVPIRANGLMLDMTVEGIRLQIPPLAMRTVTLIGLPERMVRLAQRPGWTVERQPKAAPGAIGPGPGAAVYVKRTRGTAQPADCDSFADVTDLTEVYRNGFRVKSFDHIRHSQRLGMTQSTDGIGPLRMGSRGQDINGKYLESDSPRAEFVKIFARDHPWLYKVGALYICDAGRSPATRSGRRVSTDPRPSSKRIVA